MRACNLSLTNSFAARPLGAGTSTLKKERKNKGKKGGRNISFAGAVGGWRRVRTHLRHCLANDEDGRDALNPVLRFTIAQRSLDDNKVGFFQFVLKHGGSEEIVLKAHEGLA